MKCCISDRLTGLTAVVEQGNGCIWVDIQETGLAMRVTCFETPTCLLMLISLRIRFVDLFVGQAASEIDSKSGV